MTTLFVLSVCLLYALIPAAIVLFLSTAENALRTLFACVSVLCALTSLYLLNGPTFTPEGPALFTAPFQPLLQPSLTVKILAENWLGFILAIVSGGLAFGAPLRRILTKAVIADARSMARVDLEQERNTLRAKYREEKSKLEKARSEAEQQTHDAKTKKQNLDAREREIVKQEKITNEYRQNLINDIKQHNASIEAFNDAKNEARSQIDSLSSGNEKRKGQVAQLIPFRRAWRMVYAQASEEEKIRMTSFLDKAERGYKAEQKKKSQNKRKDIPIVAKEKEIAS